MEISAFVLRFAAVWVSMLGMCVSSEAKESKPPPQLIGTWLAAVSTSSVQYSNPATGSYAPPSGWGGIYQFNAGATYTSTIIFQSTLSSCTSQTILFEEGTVAVDGDAITLHVQKLTRTATPCDAPKKVEVLAASDSTHRWWIRLDRNLLDEQCLFVDKPGLCYRKQGEPSKQRSETQAAAKAAFDKGDFQKAVLLQQKLAKDVEETEANLSGAGEATSGAFHALAWYALFARDFNAALAAAAHALAVEPANLLFATNRAHALMFLGRENDAGAAYLEHRGKVIRGQVTWQAAILEDFAEFERHGITHPQMKEIKKKLR
jgi:hypothetical protein